MSISSLVLYPWGETVHVMAEGHDVLLHGDVASDEQMETLVEAVRRTLE